MTIASDIVQQAYRENNLIPVGQSPSTAEAAEGLGLLNAVLKTLFANVIGEQLTDWLVPAPQRTDPVSANYPYLPMVSDPVSSVYLSPPDNSRIITKVPAATTIYLSQMPNDGARMGFVQKGSTATLTIDANGRTIETAATKTLVLTDTTPLQWFYRGDTGDWVALTTLVAGDTPPLPDEFDDLLITGTNLRLCPRAGKDPLVSTAARYRDMVAQAKSRYRQITPASGGARDIPAALQSYGPRWFTGDTLL